MATSSPRSRHLGRVACAAFWLLLPVSGALAAWTNVPSLSSNPAKSQFASYELYFSDSTYETPYYLNHFAQVANSVVENTFTNGGVVYPRGYLNIKVNRNPSDNTPNNARILEMQTALAYFYAANRPWNVYRGNANVKVRLEAMLTRWVAMQNTSTGLFTEYSATDYSLAPTSFGAMAVAQALDLIQDSGLAIDSTVFNNAKAALRKALMAIFTDSAMKNAGSSYSNQYSAAYHAALLYLENWPDTELDNAFVAAVQDASSSDQSPIGYFYEADGPDFGYSGVHERNLRIALTRLRNRTNDLLPVIVADEQQWASWLGANLLLQPNISTPTFLINAGINTRTSTAYQTSESRPLSEFATNSRAFSYTDTEFTNAVRTKTDSLASTPTYGSLTTNSAYSYIPMFVFEALERTEAWHPTSAERTASVNMLPYLASARFNRILHNATGNKELTVAGFRRPTYYGLFNSGRSKVNQMKFGLGMFWHPSFGTALQAVAGNFSNSISTSWGTSRTNLSRVYEHLADESTLGAVFRLNGGTLSVTNGTNSVADGTVTATYNLVDGSTNFGSKIVSFEDIRIKVDVTHTNAFTERLPLIAPTSATLTTTTNQLTFAHTNGSRLIMRLLSGGSFSVASSDTSNLPSGLLRRAVTVTATNSLSYELFVTSDAFQAGTLGALTSESYSPANAGADVGETVTYSLPLVNLLGASTSTNFNATLQSSVGVVPITTNRLYGAVAGGATATQPFTFSVSGNFGDPLTITLALRDGTNNYGTISYQTLIGGVSSALTTTSWQNFDAVSAPALPSGWIASVPSGTAGGWTTATNSPNTAPNAVSAVPTGSISEQRLESPAFVIPSAAGDPEIRFQHRWDTENIYDGGLLEISVDGGDYADIVSAGGSFLSGGYSGTLSSGYQNPLGGRQAWYGSNNAAYTQTRISLPASMLGKSVRLRFRLGCDSSVSGTIWRIDTLQLFYKPPHYIQPAEITSAAPSGAVTVGPAYTHTFAAIGQPAPAFAVTSGTLPAGLTLSPSGVLSGTVTSAFTSRAITVAATNGVTPVRTNSSQTFTLSAAVPLSISTSSPLAGGTTGSSYAQSLAATGGQGPYIWSLSAGSLPNGLALTGDTISGTPLAAGTFNFTIAVTDSASATTSKNFTIVVTNPAALSVVTPSLPGAQVGTAYSQTLAAVSGTSPYTWSRDSGTLPPGLSLSSGGVLSGNPTTAGTYNFVLRVTDAASPSGSATRSFSITVIGNLVITTASFPDARTGSSYSRTLAATGGTGSRTWSVVPPGTLPPGLSLTAMNGVVSGTPTTLGSYEFTVQVTDGGGSAATKVMSINAVNTLVWDSDPASAGIQSANGTWTAAGGTANWSISGSNVAWVDGSDGVINGGTLTLGSPVRASGLVFSNAATIAGSNALTVDAGAIITTVFDSTIAAPLSGTSFTKAGNARLVLSNAAYSGDLNVSAGELRLNEPAGERVWNGTISGGGSLLTLGSGRVVLGGSNTFTGQTTLTGSSVLRLANGSALGAANGNTRLNGDSNNAPSIELSGGISVAEPFQLIMWTPSAINTNTNHAQIRNVSGTNEITGQISVESGGGRWDIASAGGHLRVTGALTNAANVTSSDVWRTLYLSGPSSGEFSGPMRDQLGSAANGSTSKLNVTVLSGTWTLGGSNKTFTGATTVSNGTLVVASSLASEVRLLGGTLGGRGGTSSNLLVSNSAAISRALADWSSPGAAFGTALVRGTNNPSLVVRIDGTGLANFSETAKTVSVVAASNGVSGLALSNISVQTTNFPGNGTWSAATNAAGIQAVYNADVLTVGAQSLPPATRGTVYNRQLSATGGVLPRVWTVTDGSLPEGVHLTVEGSLSGIPLVSGSFGFTAEVADSAGERTSRSFVLSVANPPLVVVTESLPGATVGQPYNASLRAAGGAEPYTWSIAAGALPPGLILGANGAITGTPGSSGSYTFTARVGDADGNAAENVLSIAVAAAAGSYEEWMGDARRWPSQAAALPLADPDGDRIANILEFASDTDPLAAGGAPVTAGLESSGSQRSLHLRFRKSATARGIVFVVEASPSLSPTDWVPVAQSDVDGSVSALATNVSVDEQLLPDGSSELTVTEHSAAGTAARFLRLSVMEQGP